MKKLFILLTLCTLFFKLPAQEAYVFEAPNNSYGDSITFLKSLYENNHIVFRNKEQFVALNSDGTLEEWENNEKLDRIPEDIDSVTQVNFSGDGAIAVTENGNINWWGTINGIDEDTLKSISNVKKMIIQHSSCYLVLHKDSTISVSENRSTWGSLGEISILSKSFENLTEVIDIAFSPYNSMVLQANGKLNIEYRDEGFGYYSIPPELNNVKKIAAGVDGVALNSTDSLYIINSVFWEDEQTATKLSIPSNFGEIVSLKASGITVLALSNKGLVAEWKIRHTDIFTPFIYDLPFIKEIYIDEYNKVFISENNVLSYKIEENNSVKNIYPNPAQSTIHIDETLSVLKKEIYSLDGVLIKTDNSSNTELLVQDLASGIYTINITTEKGTRIQRFVKE